MAYTLPCISYYKKEQNCHQMVLQTPPVTVSYGRTADEIQVAI